MEERGAAMGNALTSEEEVTPRHQSFMNCIVSHFSFVFVVVAIYVTAADIKMLAD